MLCRFFPRSIHFCSVSMSVLLKCPVGNVPWKRVCGCCPVRGCCRRCRRVARPTCVCVCAKRVRGGRGRDESTKKKIKNPASCRTVLRTTRQSYTDHSSKYTLGCLTTRQSIYTLTPQLSQNTIASMPSFNHMSQSHDPFPNFCSLPPWLCGPTDLYSVPFPHFFCGCRALLRCHLSGTRPCVLATNVLSQT